MACCGECSDISRDGARDDRDFAEDISLSGLGDGTALANTGWLTAEDLDTPGCSGNGTIRGTLTHLVRVQNGWFTWFDGTLSAADAQSMRRKDADFATVAEARAAWREASDRAEACVAKLSDA